MSKLIFAVLLGVLFLSSLSNAGQIYSWDVDVEYQNAKHATMFTLFVSLETPLNSGRALQFTFPETTFNADNVMVDTAGATFPTYGTTAYTTAIATHSVSCTSGVCTITTGSNLSANTWYAVCLILNSGYVSSQAAGYKGIIKAQTMYSATTDAITYDSSNNVGVYQFATEPTTTMLAALVKSTDVTTALTTTIGQENLMWFEITPKRNTTNGAIFVVTLDFPSETSAARYKPVSWSFTKTCESVEQICTDDGNTCQSSDDIAKLAGACELVQSTDGTYTWTNQIKFTASANVQEDIKFRLAAYVQNPKYKLSNVGFTVTAESKNSKLYFEKKVVSSGFSLTSMTLTAPTFTYLWNVATLDTAKTALVAGVYLTAENAAQQGICASDCATEKGQNKLIFSDLRILLTLPSNTQTPSGVNLQVVLTTPDSDMVNIVPGSIWTNLPVSSGKTLGVTYVKGSGGATGTLTFDNVDQLTSTANSNAGYYVALKASFRNGASAGNQFATASGTVASQFAWEVKTYLDSLVSTETPVALSIGSASGSNLKVVQHYDYQDAGWLASMKDDNLSTGGGNLNVGGWNSIFGFIGSSAVDFNTGANAAAIKTANTALLENIVTGTAASGVPGYNGIPLAGSSGQLQAVFIDLLGASIDQYCCTAAANCEQSSNNALCVASPSTATNDDIRLEVVCNLNVWNIDNTAPTTDGTATGVVVAGEFFGLCGSSVCSQLGAAEDTSAFKFNHWLQDSATNYLQLTCQDAQDGVICITATTVSAGYVQANEKFGGIAIAAKTTTTSLYSGEGNVPSQLYGQQKVADFLVGFSYKTDGAASATGYSLASSSLINVITMNSALSTTVKARTFNWVKDSMADLANVKKIPQFFRVSGYFDSITTGTTLSVFLDASFDISNVGTDSAGANPGTGTYNCASSVSGVTCKPYVSSSVVPSGYPQFANRVDMIGANPSVGTSSSQFNHYFSITSLVLNDGQAYHIYIGGSTAETTSLSPNIQLGSLSADGTLTSFYIVNSIINISGYQWGSVVGYDGSTYVDIATLNAHTALKGSIGWTDLASNTGQCDAGHSSAVDCGATTVDTTNGFDIGSSAFLPGTSITNALSRSVLATDTCLDDYLHTAPIAYGGTGATIMTTSATSATLVDLIGSATVSFVHPASNAPSTDVTCVKFWQAMGSTKQYITGAVCGLFAGVAGNTAEVGSTSNIKISTLTVPYYWGYNIVPDYWTLLSGSQSGFLASQVQQQSQGTTAYQDSCTVSAWGPIYQDTKSQEVTFTFTPSTGIDLTIAATGSFLVKATLANTMSSFSIASCSITLTSGTATCAASGTLGTSTDFTITVVTAPTSSLAGNAQTISFIGDSSSTTLTATTVYLELTGSSTSSNIVDRCNQGSPVAVSVAAQDVVTFSLGTPSYTSMRTARTSFEFSFSVSSSRKLFAATYINIALGWLGQGLSAVSNNMHCIVKKGNNVDQEFSLYQYNSASPKLTLGSNQNSGSTYKFYCDGAVAPNLATTSDLSISWKQSGGTSIGAIDSESEKAVPTSLSSAVAMTTASVTKEWISQGTDATYCFSFKPKAANYTSAARVYIDFPISVSPKLNRNGMPQCRFNSSLTYCEFIAQRKLAVYPTLDMSAVATDPYTVDVLGVTQQVGTSLAYAKIAIQVDDDNNALNGIKEEALVDDSSPSSTAVDAITVTKYSSSSAFTRGSTTINMEFYVTSAKALNYLTLDKFFYVEFPDSYADRLSYTGDSGIGCSLKVAVTNGQSMTELVQNCTLNQVTRRLKVYVKANADDSMDKVYNLQLSSVPTPSQPTGAVPQWVNIYFTEADATNASLVKGVTSRTTPGHINATYSATQFADDSASKQVPNWFSDAAASSVLAAQGVTAYVGYYKDTAKVYLGASTVSKSSFKFSFGGSHASNFLTIPAEPKSEIASQSSEVTFAAKAGTSPGRYILTTASSEVTVKDQTTTLPDLPVIVKADKCQINAAYSEYKIPRGGKSLPVVFDFMSCLPTTDIGLDGNFTSTNKYGMNFVGGNSQVVVSKALTFELVPGKTPKSTITFQLESYNNSEAVSSSTTVGFTVTGTNVASFSNPNSLSAKLVDQAAYANPPTVTVTADASTIGQVTLTLQCSQMGQVFYGISLDKSNSTDITVEKIQNNTEKVDVMETPRDKKDTTWTVFGTISQEGTSQLTKTITGIKSLGSYVAFAGCTNQLSIPSSLSSVNFTAGDNGGRVAKASLNFSAELTGPQQQDIACGFVKLMLVPKERVRTQLDTYCSNVRMLGMMPELRKLQSNTTQAQNFTYFWFTLPDYSATSDSTQTTLQNTVSGANFETDLIANTNAGTAGFNVNITGKSVEVQTNTTPTPPALTTTSPTVNKINDNIDVQFSVGLSTGAGFIYAALGSQNASTPTVSQLKAGQNGLQKTTSGYAPSGQKATLTFTKLTNNTQYKFFIVGSNDVPGNDALFTEVYSFTHKALNPYVDNTFGSVMNYSIYLVVLAIMGIMALF